MPTEQHAFMMAVAFAIFQVCPAPSPSSTRSTANNLVDVGAYSTCEDTKTAHRVVRNDGTSCCGNDAAFSYSADISNSNRGRYVATKRSTHLTGRNTSTYRELTKYYMAVDSTSTWPLPTAATGLFGVPAGGYNRYWNSGPEASFSTADRRNSPFFRDFAISADPTNSEMVITETGMGSSLYINFMGGATTWPIMQMCNAGWFSIGVTGSPEPFVNSAVFQEAWDKPTVFPGTFDCIFKSGTCNKAVLKTFYDDKLALWRDGVNASNPCADLGFVEGEAATIEDFGEKSAGFAAKIANVFSPTEWLVFYAINTLLLETGTGYFETLQNIYDCERAWYSQACFGHTHVFLENIDEGEYIYTTSKWLKNISGTDTYKDVDLHARIRTLFKSGIEGDGAKSMCRFVFGNNVDVTATGEYTIVNSVYALGSDADMVKNVNGDFTSYDDFLDHTMATRPQS